MSGLPKPPIFEDVSDELFAQLPPNYRLMDTGSELDVGIATCAAFNCTIGLWPFHRPITKVFPPLETEPDS